MVNRSRNSKLARNTNIALQYLDAFSHYIQWNHFSISERNTLYSRMKQWIIALCETPLQTNERVITYIVQKEFMIALCLLKRYLDIIYKDGISTPIDFDLFIPASLHLAIKVFRDDRYPGYFVWNRDFKHIGTDYPELCLRHSVNSVEMHLLETIQYNITVQKEDIDIITDHLCNLHKEKHISLPKKRTHEESCGFSPFDNSLASRMDE